jgi:hypothetical protein
LVYQSPLPSFSLSLSLSLPPPPLPRRKNRAGIIARCARMCQATYTRSQGKQTTLTPTFQNVLNYVRTTMGAWDFWIDIQWIVTNDAHGSLPLATRRSILIAIMTCGEKVYHSPFLPSSSFFPLPYLPLPFLSFLVTLPPSQTIFLPAHSFLSRYTRVCMQHHFLLLSTNHILHSTSSTTHHQRRDLQRGEHRTCKQPRCY